MCCNVKERGIEQRVPIIFSLLVITAIGSKETLHILIGSTMEKRNLPIFINCILRNSELEGKILRGRGRKVSYVWRRR